jgi:colanic acid biosynthesis glycosyl transferase WcaI
MAPLHKNPSLLVISQAYVPDPASVGQHMADVAQTMASRGYEVVVMTSRSGYENHHIKFASRERLGGVDIVRFPLSSFGKRTIAHRLLGQILFLIQTISRGVFTRRLTGILVSTSPPMASSAALIIGFVRRVPVFYWLMDLNPDQMIALGKVQSRSPLVVAMKWLNCAIFSRADKVIVLDRFMAERVSRQYKTKRQMVILPPWPHVEVLEDIPSSENPFVKKHNLQGRFVVMYSGNHSPSSPITTLLQVALRMQDDPRFLFMFVGGGHGKRAVDEAIANERPTNIISLPYQPLSEIKYSLSAADLHVVTLGNEMPGIIHPCKIYGALAVGRPVLLIGPRHSHAGDLIDRHQIGWQVKHGDVSATIALLKEILELPSAARFQIGQRARAAVRERYSQEHLCNAFCDDLEGNTLISSGQFNPGYVIGSHVNNEAECAGNRCVDTVGSEAS